MGSEATAHSGHGAPATPRGLTHNLLQTHVTTGDGFWRAVVLLSVLVILGVVGFMLRLSDGFSDKALWGYHAAVFAFILTTAQAAPMAAIAPRLAKAHWRRPISRAAELWTVVGLFGILLFIPMLWVLPGLEDGRRTLWFFDPGEVPRYSPHIWATLALVFLVIVGIGLLWASSLPDLATVRDNSTGWRQGLAKRMAGGWIGTSQQWSTLHHRIGALGALYFMMLVFVHFLISVDFAMALVPGG